jgi:hypothetical protein
MANLTKKSGSMTDVLSPSVVETVVKCVEAASIGQSNITYFKIAATSLRKNQYYYRIYFVGANTVFGHIIPFALLVIINVLIVRVLNAKPKPDDIVVSTNARPNVTTETTTTTHQIVRKSTIRVTTSVKRKVFVTRRTSSTVSTTYATPSLKVRRHETLNRSSGIPPPLSPSVFGLDSENISYIDSPVIGEVIVETDVLLRQSEMSNGHAVVEEEVSEKHLSTGPHHNHTQSNNHSQISINIQNPNQNPTTNSTSVNQLDENNRQNELHQTLSNQNSHRRKKHRSRRGDSVYSHAQSSTVTVTVFVNEVNHFRFPLL